MFHILRHVTGTRVIRNKTTKIFFPIIKPLTSPLNSSFEAQSYDRSIKDFSVSVTKNTTFLPKICHYFVNSTHLKWQRVTVRSAFQSCVVAHSQMNNPHGAPISREFKKTSTVSKRERAGKEHLDQQHFCATVFIITAAILSLSSTFQITVWAE